MLLSAQVAFLANAFFTLNKWFFLTATLYLSTIFEFPTHLLLSVFWPGYIWELQSPLPRDYQVSQRFSEVE